MHTFGAVVVLVELPVLRLLLPADQVEGQISVGKGWRGPLHHQPGGGVGKSPGLFGHRRHCNRAKVRICYIKTF